MHDVVGDASGELDVVAQAELVAQRDELVEAVTGAHQREGDVGAAELVNDDVGRAQDVVDAVLRSHHADVRREMAAATAAFRVCVPAPQLLGVGAGAHDGDVIAVASARGSSRRARTTRWLRSRGAAVR